MGIAGTPMGTNATADTKKQCNAVKHLRPTLLILKNPQSLVISARYYSLFF